MMKKILTVVMWICLLSGCGDLRFAPSETQKQNAWVHNRTTAIAADTARVEKASEKLQALTRLSKLHSRAFVSYYGLPKQFPPVESAEDVLSQSKFQLARAALSKSAQRPDAWQIADGALELGIGVAALLGGVYGTRAARLLRQARDKSKALREIITGNELFKKQNADLSNAFKAAHRNQSPQTRQIVAEMKS